MSKLSLHIEEEMSTIDSRILKLKPGQFRAKLYLEHVIQEGVEIYLITNTFGREEKVGVLIEHPIRSPFISYYKSGFTTSEDPYLKKLVLSLMYINQGIDMLGMKKMTEYLITIHCAKNPKGFPVLSYEEVFPVVKNYVNAFQGVIPKLLYTTVVLYSEHSMLTAKERREYSLSVRNTKMSRLSAELIHDAAIMAIKITNPELKITRPKVLENVKENKVKTVKTLNKHIREDTVDLLDEVNQNRIFKSELSYNKYKEFLALPTGLTVREQSERLNVSASTIISFKNKK